LKNTLDWVSRPGSKDEPRLSAYQGKKAALIAASPGALGGLRGLSSVRSILSNIGVWVCPTQLAVPKAHEILKDRIIEDSHTLNSISNLIDDFTG
ncbi:MAG: NAD(P)H-dependent oxidoreductase, partial [Candidatus Omnitrophica bacterium]|nr:NAD(P)H-dependent oxidoreductase [Candidatus Omnitrophota bacterium]